MYLIEDKRGLLLILLAGLISGFSIFINGFGVKEFDSSLFTFLKNVTVAIFLFSIILIAGNFSKLKSLKKKHWIQLIIIGFIGGSIPFLLFFKGLQMTSGTTSAFIQKTLFIFVSVFALMFLKEKINKSFLIGASLILTGTYFMIKPNFSFSIGHILILIATIFWAIEVTFAKHVLKEVSGTMVGFGRMFFGSLFILIFLLFTGKISLTRLINSQQIGWIVLTSVFLFLYVFSFYNGLKRVKVSIATAIISIGAPITATLNFIFQGKSITLNQSIGIFLIIIGIVLVTWFAHIVSFITRIWSIKQNERG